MNQPIISDAEARQILRNDLRKVELQKRAGVLNNATPEKRSEIMAQVEKDVEEELKKRFPRTDLGILLR